jgi:hypothetical protein
MGLSKSGSAKAIFCDRNHGRSPADASYRGPCVIGAIELKEKSMNTLRNRVIAAAGLAVLALPSTALAGFKPSAELRSACMGDAMRLCSASLFSMDSLQACLQAKKSQASPKCQAQYDAETKTATQR